jgi:hypothetical protein
VRFFDSAAHARHVRELHADRRWFSELASGLRSKLVAEPEVWRLAPTQRSKSYP